MIDHEQVTKETKEFTPTIQALPLKDGPPLRLRLRSLLKAMLRTYGFRCLSIKPDEVETV